MPWAYGGRDKLPLERGQDPRGADLLTLSVGAIRSPALQPAVRFCPYDSSTFTGGGTGWPRRIRCRRLSWFSFSTCLLAHVAARPILSWRGYLYPGGNVHNVHYVHRCPVHLASKCKRRLKLRDLRVATSWARVRIILRRGLVGCPVILPWPKLEPTCPGPTSSF